MDHASKKQILDLIEANWVDGQSFVDFLSDTRITDSDYTVNRYLTDEEVREVLQQYTPRVTI